MNAHPGIFADKLPVKERSDLARIGLAAADASEALSKHIQAVTEDSPEWDRLSDAEFDTRHAFYDHLLEEYGITTNEARRIASVLL